MEFTLQKTIVFLLFIGIGILLKLKFKKQEEIIGIKRIILNLALPATICIALLGIELDTTLLVLPVMALFLNLFLFLGFPYLLPLTGIPRNTPEYRTAGLLIPSLAPGLSCFPFVLEFLGEGYLAKAAMADLGNKVFVLLILYVIAMNWHYRLRSKKRKAAGPKLKALVKVMIVEPVNIFIIVALVLVFFGFTMDSLPFFISDTLNRLSMIMTPLVLLFIGLAVRIGKNQLITFLSMLLLRAGTILFLIGVFVTLFTITIQEDILLLLAFGLSACSFWPFAHISVVDDQESEVVQEQRTFNSTFAINILALSFPLSTVLILGILSSGPLFSSIGNIFLLGFALCFFGLLPILIKHIRKVRVQSAIRKSKWIQYRISSTENQ